MLEETLSGIGTTHCTNGIEIQRSVDTCAEKPDDKEVNFSKKGTLEDFHIQILPYCGKKGSDPQAIQLKETTVKGSSDEIKHSKKNDFLWLICKLDVSDSLFPTILEALSISSWTGFNAILCESNIPRKSVVGYCPTIDASTTGFSTMYTLLVRFIKMADQIRQHDVPVVFDREIYAKAVEVICQRSEELSRVVTRIEAFHIACTLLAVIRKRFRDAGLEDVIIESEIIGIGSINIRALLIKYYNRVMQMHKIVGEALF